jgi:hypothetical protein
LRIVSSVGNRSIPTNAPERPITPQPRRMRKAPRPRHHPDQERCERLGRIDRLRRFQPDRQMLPHLLAKSSSSQEFNEHAQPTPRRHRPPRLAQNHFFSAPK